MPLMPVASLGQGFGDRNPSLSVSNGDRGLVFWCFAGCELRSIRSALGHLDLNDAAEPVVAARFATSSRKMTADALAEKLMLAEKSQHGLVERIRFLGRDRMRTTDDTCPLLVRQANRKLIDNLVKKRRTQLAV